MVDQPGIQRRLIGNAKPAIWESGGPAHHRINAETAYFYRNNANSRIAVTPKVTPMRTACLEGRRAQHSAITCATQNLHNARQFLDLK